MAATLNPTITTASKEYKNEVASMMDAPINMMTISMTKMKIPTFHLVESQITWAIKSIPPVADLS